VVVTQPSSRTGATGLPVTLSHYSFRVKIGEHTMTGCRFDFDNPDYR
jgi:hypothetical protein